MNGKMNEYERFFVNFRKKCPKPIQHFPLIQSVVHSAFFFEQKYVRECIKNMEDEYQNLTKDVVRKFDGK